MPKRRERVAPPPARQGWDVRYGTNDAVKGWDELAAAAPSNLRAAWERLTTDPRRHDARQHRLKGSLGTRAVAGRALEQWQYEVTGAGRIWYVVDDEARTVWLTGASVGHPKATD